MLKQQHHISSGKDLATAGMERILQQEASINVRRTDGQENLGKHSVLELSLDLVSLQQYVQRWFLPQTVRSLPTNMSARIQYRWFLAAVYLKDIQLLRFF